MSVYVHDTHLACYWRLPRVVVCTCNAILPQAREHVNSIEDVQAAPTQVVLRSGTPPASYAYTPTARIMSKAVGLVHAHMSHVTGMQSEKCQ